MIVQIYKCRNKSHPFPLFAWLIMIFQGMKPWDKAAWSHMSMSVGSKFFDITGKGCKEHYPEDFLETYTIIESHRLEYEPTKEDFYEFFDSMRAKKYDKLQIFGLLLKGLNIISFNTIGHNMDKLVCNELIIAYLFHFNSFKFKDSDNFGLINTWNKVKEY